MNHIKIAWNDKSATFTCVGNHFCFVWWSRLTERSAKTYEKWSFFSICSRLGHFPQFFGQIKEWLMLELKKMIRVSYAAVGPIVFSLFGNSDWKGGVLKFMKHDHFVVLSAAWFLPHNFWGRLKVACIRTAENDKSVTYGCSPNCFYFILWARLAGRGVQIYGKWSFSVLIVVLALFPKFLGRLKSGLC